MTIEANSLSEMVIDEIALCGEGINPDAKMILAKAQPNMVDVRGNGSAWKLCKADHSKLKSGEKCPECGVMKKSADVQVLTKADAAIAKARSAMSSTT